MSNQALENIADISGLLSADSSENNRLGRVSDASAEALRHSGVMRMLQLKEYGGGEAHPNDFYTAVMEVAAKDPSAGWLAGVVGVHPHEASLNDRQLLEEIWAEDSDTWIASPYAPMGVLTPVEGGYLLNGRWTFSSGTDHCGWVVLGALMGDEEGVPAGQQHFHVMLPRSDYEIIQDSWNVVGLGGTGSKDVVVEGAFIPSYRVMDVRRLVDGTAFAESGLTNPLYNVPWAVIFPNAICSAVLGICQGALDTALEYQKGRVAPSGVMIKDDPYILPSIGEAMAELHASKVTLLHNTAEIYETVSAGREVSVDMRIINRRDQVRSAWRSVRAINDVFTHCGGTALKLEHPMHRFWLDANAGLNHYVFSPGPIFHASAASGMGLYPEDVIKKAIVY